MTDDKPTPERFERCGAKGYETGERGGVSITPAQTRHWALIALIIVQMATGIGVMVHEGEVPFGYLNGTAIAIGWYITEVVFE